MATEKTILLAEDEEMLHMVARKIIESMNYTVISAFNGEEAVSAYKENPSIDLVILDMKMPKMDGKEAFALIKEINSEAKIILSSGLSADSEIEMILSSFPDTSFIQKPYRKAQLSEMIQSIVGSNS
ncbi:MAG TPA: response regulator [Spirochaetota bacterium]|nr:response regulator [Spirochaetota bacterium]HPM33818.1 response regulator [Spirochaetota bacterium]